VIRLSELTENVFALKPPNATVAATVKLVPVIVTGVPTPAGRTEAQDQLVTRNILLLVSVPPGVVTVTEPVVAPVGTVAVK